MTDARPRIVVDALAHLRAGRDVVLIAYPQDEATRLRNAVLTEAIRAQIKTWNEHFEDELPMVRCRPYGCRAVEVDRSLPESLRPVVIYDASARFDRGSVRNEACRSVTI